MVSQYTMEFKEEAVKLVTEKGYSQAEAARCLGISEKNINRWLHEGKEKKGQTVEKMTEEQKELKRLRLENERLRMEKEILKKAAAFFANEKN